VPFFLPKTETIGDSPNTPDLHATLKIKHSLAYGKEWSCEKEFETAHPNIADLSDRP
jgi:hypothetical protein